MTYRVDDPIVFRVKGQGHRRLKGQNDFSSISFEPIALVLKLHSMIVDKFAFLLCSYYSIMESL